MQKSISTLLGCLALILFLSPSLIAQQTSTESKERIIIVKKSSDENGTIEVDQKALETGEKFQEYFKQLELENSDGKDIKIEVFSSEDADAVLEMDEANDEETIFIFKSAKSDKGEEIERLVITLNEAVELDRAELTKKSNKPLLGVYSEDNEKGALITGVVYNSGAQKAGIQKGDIITALNGTAVTGTKSLSAAIIQFETGETIDVKMIRGGASTEVAATLGNQRSQGHYNNFYARNNNRYNTFQDRDPCKVFIGVYTSDSRNGMKVHNIIANTPAAKANLQVGDRILAIDDVEVYSHNSLVAQRDLHQAGDDFTLSILRDGQQIEVDAQFQACPEDVKTEEIIIEDGMLQKEEPITPLEAIQNTLDIEDLSVFPNPTTGPINVSFKGEAKPTTIRVTDAMGKVVYEEELKTFDGVYNNTLRLKSAAPGNLIISIQQDQKVFSQSLILMPRA